jgi:response regulator NasT
MRVWLVDDRPGDDPDGLESLLNQVAARPELGLSLLVVRPGWSDFVSELLLRPPHVLLVREAPWLDGPWTVDVLNHGPALLVAGDIDSCERFRGLAEEHPIAFLPSHPSLEGLWLALVSAQASQHRQAAQKTKFARLQQRLDDRIIIERAKGILVQRMGLTEEEAYKRMRVLSRRQRRQIRDIAQSFLDSQSLLIPDEDGFLDNGSPPRAKSVQPTPPVKSGAQTG